MPYSRLPRSIACAIALVMLAACSAPVLKTPVRIPAYAGPLRTIDEVGVFLPGPSVKVNKVDGVDVGTFKRADSGFGLGGWEIELLPGTYSIEFDYLLEVPAYAVRSSVPTIKIVNVEAGHVYIANGVTAPNSRWDVKVADVTALERANLAARRAVTAN
jgi:hypothetical protein